MRETWQALCYNSANMKKYIYLTIAVALGVLIGHWIWRRIVRSEEQQERDAITTKVALGVLIGNWIWRKTIRHEQRQEHAALKTKFERRDRIGFAAEMARNGDPLPA